MWTATLHIMASPRLSSRAGTPLEQMDELAGAVRIMPATGWVSCQACAALTSMLLVNLSIPHAVRFGIERALSPRAICHLQEEHHPLLSRPSGYQHSGFQPTLSLSGAASLARVDSSFGMRALERLNPEGAMAEPISRLTMQVHSIIVACDHSLQVLALDPLHLSLSLASPG